MRAVKRYVAFALAIGMSLSGCGVVGSSGLAQTPLPGGAELGPHPYRVTVQFPDVLNLVPQSSVKVNDVAVGMVRKIDLADDGKTALVTVVINGQVRLPANALAKLRQSSLLGEKFVELTEPVREQPRGQLRDGAVIPVSRTNRNSEIEEILGALSMLLNGGNVEQLNTITKELNASMVGNEAQLRSLLSNIDHLTADLNNQRGNITQAIDALNRLSATFAANRGRLAKALDQLDPGVRVLNQQRDQLVTMLEQLDKLSRVAITTVGRSKDEMVADLRLLAPVLEKLRETGADLPQALNYMVTFPFPVDATKTLRGDYFNADLYIDMDLSTVVNNLITAQPAPGMPPAPPPSGAPVLPLLPAIPPGKLPPPPQQLPRAPQGGLLGPIVGGH